jgi:hypothetical protein
MLNLQTARTEAVMLAGELLRGGAAKFWEKSDWNLEVTDGRGQPLFRLDFVATEAAPVDAGSR